jgi:hypothetical protein
MAPRKTTTPAKSAAPAPVDDTDLDDTTIEDVDATEEPIALSDIPDELQFTSADQGEFTHQTVSFSIDGFPLEAFQPTRGSLLLLTSTFSQNADETDILQGILGFYNSVLTPASKMWFNRYVRDPKFDESVLWRVMEALAKQWKAEDLLPERLPEGKPTNRAGRRAAGRTK